MRFLCVTFVASFSAAATAVTPAEALDGGGDALLASLEQRSTKLKVRRKSVGTADAQPDPTLVSPRSPCPEATNCNPSCCYEDKTAPVLGGVDFVDLATSKRQGQDAPEMGSAAYSAQLNGYTFHFITAENARTFKANPWVFAPAFGGFCAQSVALEATCRGCGAPPPPPPPSPSSPSRDNGIGGDFGEQWGDCFVFDSDQPGPEEIDREVPDLQIASGGIVDPSWLRTAEPAGVANRTFILKDVDAYEYFIQYYAKVIPYGDQNWAGWFGTNRSNWPFNTACCATLEYKHKAFCDKQG